MRSLSATFFLSLLLTSLVAAQNCGTGNIILKNDTLPDLPSGATAVGVVPGLCEGEAAMSIFQTGGPVSVNSVAVMFGSYAGTNGVQAVVDIEIYDGITPGVGGRWVLGPRVFRLSDLGSNLQIQTHGINTYTLPAPVRVTSGQCVVGWRMVLNTATGSCASGYTANFCVDAAPTCRPGINVLDAIGHGPIDPVTYNGFGVPLCPIYFRGSWIIRACVTPEITTGWTGNPAPGGLVQLQLRAPGHGNERYLLMAASGASTGFATPWGRIPLDNDWLFQCFFGACRPAMFINDFALLNAAGDGFAVLRIPNLPVLVGSNFPIYCAFVTSNQPGMIPFTGVSSPSPVIRIN
ncbi:MAG: hypothetical protein HZB39_11685 [Planctomycetes bacterium]|nr:hypothetical protein [Planctomycetota bacterium]